VRQAWRQSNISGFDNDPQNETVTTLTAFGGELWAGTFNILSGNGFQLWRMDSSGQWYPEWEGDPSFSNTVAIDHMIVFGDSLFTGSWNEVDGGGVFSFDGTDWSPASDMGFGDPANVEVVRFAAFDDTLYAGTCNVTGAEIWRSSTGTMSDWTQVVSNGSGDANNRCVISYADLDDTLYAGTINFATGGEVWRSATGNAGTWSQVNTDGFGTANNRVISALAAFNNLLYASTMGNSSGAQVWRCQVCDGSDWSRVVNNGFGNANTNRLSALEVFDGHLYFVVGNYLTGLEVWRTADGTNWEQVGFGGFGNANNRTPFWDNSVAVYNGSLYVGTVNWTDGGEVWRYLHTIYLPLAVRSH
jgi:tripartite motif-containing protein 71